jgi:hypothetical protein
MKTLALELCIGLAAVLVLGCNSSTDEQKLLRKVMVEWTTTHLNKPYSEESKNGMISFGWSPEVVATMDSAFLSGSYRTLNNFLIVALEENREGTSYYTGIFTREGSNWNSIFEANVIPGTLDTLLDLNSDGKPELIIEYSSNGNDSPSSEQFLYAIKSGEKYERIDRLAATFQSFGFGRENLAKVSSIRFDNTETEIRIIVDEKRSWTDGTREKPIEKNYASSFRYTWQPPQLIRQIIFDEEDDEIASACTTGPDEYIVESRNLNNVVIQVITFDGPSGSSNSLRTCLNGKRIDEISLFSEGSGGVAYIMFPNYGNYLFDSDSLIRVEQGQFYVGPVLNGRHIQGANQDSIILKDGGGFTSLDGTPLPYVNEFHWGDVAFYKIGKTGKIERILWSNNWSSLDTIRKAKLAFIRNEVFARHGLIFKTEPFKSYFNHYPYDPKYDNVNDKLTEEEKRFVMYIKKLEENK